MTANEVASRVQSSSAVTEQIAELPPTPAEFVGVAVNPKTGEPRRVWALRLASLSFLLATAAVTASILMTYWNSVENFAAASALMSWFPQPSILTQVLLALAVTAIALVIAASSSITAYYAWFGYGWTRVAGLVSAALSLLALLLNPVGWAAIGFAFIGAALLWLPPVNRFFSSWQAQRHPQQGFGPPAVGVFYGPLPRYRRS